MSGNGFKRDVGPGAVTFRDRVDTMTWWFREWSPCEQTISVYSLLYQLSPSHVKFLSTVMDVYLQDHAEDELEGEANDPGKLYPPSTHTLRLFDSPPFSFPHAHRFYQLTLQLERRTSARENPRPPPASSFGQRVRSEGVHEPPPKGPPRLS